ncbi:MAG: hypothetical protein IIA88_09695 [Bacteroidetes bacterium]|nr:hypothetical protein [Bacteroidota bacterium]
MKMIRISKLQSTWGWLQTAVNKKSSKCPVKSAEHRIPYCLPRQLTGLCAMLILSTVLQYSCVNKKENLWTKTVGGKNADWGYSVQKTKDGGYIFAGITSSFGAGDHDVYLIRTNANGDTLWTKTYGGTDDDRGY